MLAMLFETGHPWITFKDPCNLRSPQQHVGGSTVPTCAPRSPCNTNDQEIAVCNLGSVNLAAHVGRPRPGQRQAPAHRHHRHAHARQRHRLQLLQRPPGARSNLRHRPVGLGLMGFQDALYKLRIPYATQEAVQFADESMEAIAYYASAPPPTSPPNAAATPEFRGLALEPGHPALDSIDLLETGRGGYLEMDRSQTRDWAALRARVLQVGMRNSNCMAIAPTATISNIVRRQSVHRAHLPEPLRQVQSLRRIHRRQSLPGRDLKELGLWDAVMVNDLKYFDGSVQAIDRVPAALKALYATAFEIDARWLVEAGSRRQKWLDQAQSLNLYMSEPNGKKLDNLYKLAWVRGLKTTYYLRSMGATHVEKPTSWPCATSAWPSWKK
jgi:ribonucleoside-diphosphate reductase alpha chain